VIVPLTTADFLARGARTYPDRIGVVDEPNQPAAPLGAVTFGQMQARAQAVAAGLDTLGIGPGERVAAIGPNSARMLDLLYGVTASGRILVPINFRLKPAEVAYIVGDAEIALLLVDPELDAPLAGVNSPRRMVLGEPSDAELLRFDRQPANWGECDESATATINYTSGTTARPKGVELTHRNLWISSVVLALHLGVTDRDVYLHTVPMFHVNGWNLPFPLAALGVPQIILRKVDGPTLLERIENHQVTLCGGAPTVLDIALDAAASTAGHESKQRVRVLCGGAPPPPRTIARLEDRLGWEFMQIYGLTEASPVLVTNRARAEDDTLDPDERLRRLTRAGTPVLGLDMHIGTDGEVLARGNQIFARYWRAPEATRDALADGWLHTGDGGRLEDGYLTVTDRKKDVIITGGENVASIEVENALYSHPAVADVAVIGVPHPRWGETVTALVVLADGQSATPADIIAHARSHLAHYKCPTSVEFVDALPRTATGKIQKFRLRERYRTAPDAAPM